MKKNVRNTNPTIPAHAWVRSVLVAMLAVLFVAGCAASWGRTAGSARAQAIFAQSQFPDDHNFYYLGFASAPDAILGIRAGHKVEGRFWKPVDRSVHSLENMTAGVRASSGCIPGRSKTRPSGYSVYDQHGNDIGLLFSCYTNFAVMFDADNRVSISYPDPMENRTILY